MSERVRNERRIQFLTFAYLHDVGVSVSHRLYLDSIAEAAFSNDFQLSIPVHYYDLRIISLFYNFIFSK